MCAAAVSFTEPTALPVSRALNSIPAFDHWSTLSPFFFFRLTRIRLRGSVFSRAIDYSTPSSHLPVADSPFFN